MSAYSQQQQYLLILTLSRDHRCCRRLLPDYSTWECRRLIWLSGCSFLSTLPCCLWPQRYFIIRPRAFRNGQRVLGTNPPPPPLVPCCRRSALGHSPITTINSKIQQAIPLHGKITRQEERTTTCTQLCLVESILTSIIYLSPLHISNRWIPVFSYSTVIRRCCRRPREDDKNCIGVG